MPNFNQRNAPPCGAQNSANEQELAMPATHRHTAGIVKRTMLALVLVIAVGVRAQAANAKLFMWRIQSAAATAYLLGSIHVAKPEMYPLDPQIEKAFRESNVLVVEADASPEKAGAMALQMMMRASYPAGDSLDKHISKELLAAAITKSGLPEAQVKLLKPWFLAMAVTLIELQKVGIDPQLGLDLHFLQSAKGKPIVELEGTEAQVNLLDGFTDREQEQFLKYSLKDAENIGKHVNEMIAAWNAGDAKKIEDYLSEAANNSPDMQSLLVRLFDERNKQMAVKIEDLLKTRKTYFVVVGAGHLVGKNGLLQLLGKTERIEQVPR
jgi:uncharacterized protein YbaP (TraB family)